MPSPPDRPTPGAAPALGPDARALLLAAAGPGGTGWIVAAFAPGHARVAAGGRQFVTGGSPTEAARWRAAVDELVAAGLIRPPDPGGWVCRVTGAGYDLADRLTARPGV
jgi:hypothetical protein